MKVALTIEKGPGMSRVVEFREPRGVVIGRARDADVSLPPDDPYVSRRHAYLEICPPSCRLRNLGTDGAGATNTPHVNGEPVFEERELAAGDLIELGYTRLRLAIAAEPLLERRKCGRCGRETQLVCGDQAPDRCDACLEDSPAPPPRRPDARVDAVCWECGGPLGDRPNSDGRAEELHRVALYACPACAERLAVAPEDCVGRYRILKGLGEGGMGAVHLACHADTGRLVALKRVRDLKEPSLVKRFERETRLMKQIDHAHIVRCIDVGIDGEGAPYLVSEYVPGADLEATAQAAPFRASRARCALLDRIEEVLSGLEYLHAKRIVHRDVKPQNILLLQRHARDAGPGTEAVAAKIADFGLAVSYARAGGTRLTKPGMFLGTLMYMPPEQVRDPATVDHTADLYALGVTLYYLLTGHYTFDFPTPADVAAFQRQQPELWKRPHDALRALMQLRRILHPFQIILGEEPTPVRGRDQSVPEPLAAVIDRAVRKDPGARFQSAAEFRSALIEAAARRS
jgi:serine/threonine-protein kinase